MRGLSLLLTLPIRFDIIKGVIPYCIHGILLVGVKKSLFGFTIENMNSITEIARYTCTFFCVFFFDIM